MTTLTKSSYLTFRQCPKAFWLAQFRPELEAPPDPARLRHMQAGQAVDVRARALFPDGRLIPWRPQPEEMAALTRQAVADGVQTLFQATFLADDLLVKADIVTRTAAGWHLIEVKSATRRKDQHLADVAFQVCVARQAGVPISRAALLHLNSGCRAPDLGTLFAQVDLTGEVEALLPTVEADIAVMRGLVQSADIPPPVPIGRHCICPFRAHCWAGITGLTIHDIPRLSPEREQPLQAAGILVLGEISADYPLTPAQRQFVTFHVRQQITIDRPAIRQALDKLRFPLHFLDFETIDYPVPRFDGCKPYQPLPFQYSCHILAQDGTLTHHDYLHTDHSDPRRPLAEALLGHIGETGSVIAWNIPFERGVLHDLAAWLPDHAGHLRHIADRLWDQLPIFRNHYRDYRFGKSSSLKAVLPVLVPELGYKSLKVQNGTQAQVAWEELARETDARARQQMADHLRAYCHLDTLAMVEIHRVLVRTTMGGNR
jgi:hypothetical protein